MQGEGKGKRKEIEILKWFLNYLFLISGKIILVFLMNKVEN